MVAEFFDIGQSRSVPWERRPEAGRLLGALKDSRRTWNAVVVGEGTRCWFGNQFSLIAPRFAAYGVELWVPELGGRFDARNPSHKMLMSVLGGMSESERQHVQARVRAAMDAQVVNEGRHQGGRAPYGYMVVDGGPHLREEVVLPVLHQWIGGLFDRQNLDDTVRALVDSQGLAVESGTRAVAKQRLADAETVLRRHQAAIAAGIDPSALVEATNEAQAKREAARTELAAAPSARPLGGAEVYAMIDSLGDVGTALKDAKPERLARLYADLRLDLRYEPAEKAVYATASPRVVSECVRGGTCALTLRLNLGAAA